jgi:hypothetical protein
VRPTETENALHVTNALIPIAQARIDAQSQDWDSHDTKSLGLIAITLAAIGLLFTFRSSLHQLWLVPVLGLSISTFLFYISVRRRKFNLGPDLQVFYQNFGIAPPLVANQQMLSQLFLAIEENDHLIPVKRRRYTWGERVLVASFVVIVLLLMAAPARLPWR